LQAIGLRTSRQGYGVTLNKVSIEMVLPTDRKIQLADLMVLSGTASHRDSITRRKGLCQPLTSKNLLLLKNQDEKGL